MLFNFHLVEASELTLEEKMKEKINLLGEDTSFAYIDLELTTKELDLIDQLSIIHPLHYNRYGDLDLLEEELPDFLQKLGNNSEETITATSEVICRIVKNVVNASNKDSAWIAVRAFTPTKLFDIPRWHIDGPYYGFNGPLPYPGIVYKFAATLKGSPTLLYNLPKDLRDIFNFNYDNDDRTFLSELLSLDKAESPKRGEGVFFIVGDDKLGAVHSEPKIHKDRLFFFILIGDKSEIEELYTRWYPNNLIN